MKPLNAKTVLAGVVLAVSCFVVANTLIQTRPVSIIIQDNTQTVIEAPAIYGITEAVTLVVTSWLAGISAAYLYFSAPTRRTIIPRIPTALDPNAGQVLRLEDLETVNTALKVLREPGKKILEVIISKGGEVLQKDLPLETNFTKARISRTLRELEARNIVQRKQYGGTKKIVLSDWLKRGVDETNIAAA